LVSGYPIDSFDKDQGYDNAEHPFPGGSNQIWGDSHGRKPGSQKRA
jgi:hypothetical protein